MIFFFCFFIYSLILIKVEYDFLIKNNSKKIKNEKIRK